MTLDLETENLDPYHNKILLIAYRYNGTGPVFQIKIYDNELPPEDFISNLADPSITKRGHNCHFDLLCLSAAGYVVDGPIDDTRLLAYVENPQQELDLKGLVERKLKRQVIRMEDFGCSRLSKHKKAYLKKYISQTNHDHPLLKQRIVKCGNLWVAKSKLEQYNKMDVINCDDLRDEIVTTDWYKKIEQPLSKILLKAEELGMQLDISYLEETRYEFEKLCEESRQALGTDFNANSYQQVKEKFKSQGIEMDRTDKHVLKLLSWGGNNFASSLLRFRGLSKLLGTYIKPFLEIQVEGRIHGRFNQAGHETRDFGDKGGTATGRLSSSDPNLQNIPSRTEEGKKVRKAIIATPGWFLIDSDLKQIEPRLIAHFSQSKVLLEAYERGLDTHAIMGGLIFGKEPDNLSKLERFIGKTSWLATVYGCWYKKLRRIVEVNSDEPIFYDDKFYENIQTAFWKSNPEISSWRESLINTTRSTGSIKTIGGRIIKIPGIHSKDKWERQEAERLTVNYLIQGSAADIMKMIIVNLCENRPEIRLLATIHDEVLLETKDEKMIDVVNYIMGHTVFLDNVAIEADTKLIQNWGEK